MRVTAQLKTCLEQGHIHVWDPDDPSNVKKEGECTCLVARCARCGNVRKKELKEENERG